CRQRRSEIRGAVPILRSVRKPDDGVRPPTLLVVEQAELRIIAQQRDAGVVTLRDSRMPLERSPEPVGMIADAFAMHVVRCEQQAHVLDAAGGQNIRATRGAVPASI